MSPFQDAGVPHASRKRPSATCETSCVLILRPLPDPNEGLSEPPAAGREFGPHLSLLGRVWTWPIWIHPTVPLENPRCRGHRESSRQHLGYAIAEPRPRFPQCQFSQALDTALGQFFSPHGSTRSCNVVCASSTLLGSGNRSLGSAFWITVRPSDDRPLEVSISLPWK